MDVVRTPEEIDIKLIQIAAAAAQSDEAARHVFSSFKMDFSASVPSDPFSAEYADCQMQLYERIAGRNYAHSNEVSAFNVEAAVLRPFPLNSGSTATTGAHLSALGFVIGRLKLPPGATILEFGPGWGNTTMTLAMLGFQVTAVDIERNFCDLIRERAKLNEVAVEVVHDDFFLCERISRQFDAVLFYECFHHCADHMRLLRGLHKVVKPGGRVYLGCEPITDDFPLPWGVRLDGELLWAIRQNGWMELGFNASYFREALARAGWFARSHMSQDVGFGNLWELERPLRSEIFIPASDPRVCSLIGRRADGCITSDGNGTTGYLVYGPYITLAAGAWRARIRLSGEVSRGWAKMDVCNSRNNEIFAAIEFILDHRREPALELDFTLPAARPDIEVRLLCDGDAAVSVTAVELSPI